MCNDYRNSILGLETLTSVTLYFGCFGISALEVQTIDHSVLVVLYCRHAGYTWLSVVFWRPLLLLEIHNSSVPTVCSHAGSSSTEYTTACFICVLTICV